MRKINIKTRFKNKVFLMSFTSTILLLLSQLGLDKFLPFNLSEIVDSLLVILSLLGVIVDPTTDGMYDTDYVIEGKNTNDIKREYNEFIGRKLAQLNGLQEELERTGMSEFFDYAGYGEQELKNDISEG